MMINKTNTSNNIRFLSLLLINACSGKCFGLSISKAGNEEISINQVNFDLSHTSRINLVGVEAANKLIVNTLIDQTLLNQQIITYLSLGIDTASACKAHVRSINDLKSALPDQLRSLSCG